VSGCVHDKADRSGDRPPTGTVAYYLRQASIPIRERGFTRQYDTARKDLVKLRRRGLSPID
jgi:hypothetical protein